MKAVVVEIKDNTAALLTQNGIIIESPNYDYEIGREVEITMKKKINLKKIIPAAVAACVMIFGGTFAYAYFTPYTYVSLDVNPSIEYELNRFDQVLSVTGVNEDGEDILDNLDIDDLKYASIDDAIQTTIQEISDEGYFDSGDGGIVITTSSNNEDDADDLADELEDFANEVLDENDKEAVVSAEAVGKQRVDEAKELGVTPGKLNLVEKLIDESEISESDETINLDEWLDKSVKEIMSKSNEYKEINKNKEKNQGEETSVQNTNTEEEQNGSTVQNEETTKKNEEKTTPDNSNKGSKKGTTEEEDNYTEDTELTSEEFTGEPISLNENINATSYVEISSSIHDDQSEEATTAQNNKNTNNGNNKNKN